MNIEAKGEKEVEEMNVNLYEMVKKCVIGGNEAREKVNRLLDLNVNWLEDKQLFSKKTRANSMI